MKPVSIILRSAGAALLLTLSGCYYPYGYYPYGYGYSAVPLATTQQDVPVGQQPDQNGVYTQAPPAQAQSNPASTGYVPPAYTAVPAYYPAYPAYPAYYGYPAWYGPSVAIGFGFWGGCCYRGGGYYHGGGYHHGGGGYYHGGGHGH
ncbi:MAG: hypothetical protein EPN73_09820 [Paraburkholderia sp.]|uniref:hypothetical protein n=1 Tax=Paraburkholderia sp. TaxID=1926495 RepID=UPI0012272D39|nr:hypothetical protein [Paraburkholderia sp.]TAL96566.1 MAG: hypothetical protein EPN73_09820 [Paraburkholderia sp.]